ncbi:MAG: uL15m family ribosomal protein [Candidatus Odinarchaeota archaeon]
MVIKRKTKKTWRKHRGKRTSGYGRISGGHRKSGSRGGVGGAGLKDHHWIRSIKEGFRSPFGFIRHHDAVTPPKAINVGQLDSMVDSLASEQKIGVKGGIYVIDLATLGYDKLLGSGKVHHKLNVTLERCTERARDKITTAGGSVTETTSDDE